ncbi:MAG: HDOD domain-containing protein, partial [Mariprofundaceae bacterium]
ILLSMEALTFDRSYTLELISITKELPTLPDRFLKIQEVVNDPYSGTKDIANIVKTDQATTAIVMKVANSPAYNPMNKPISKLPEAISRIGSTETINISLSMSLLYGFAIPTGMAGIRRFWAHAFAVGELTQHLSKHFSDTENLPNPDTMFLAGLLHDIGRAVLGLRVDMSYFEREFNAISDGELIEAERKVYGVDHAEVGSVILAKWGMPDDVLDIVANHHNPDASLATRICSIADAFAHKHLAHIDSIEGVQIALKEDLLEKVVETLYTEGLLEKNEEEEEEALS